MRCQTERFDDGGQTVRCYDDDHRLVRIETYAAGEQLKAAIDYLYDAAGNNTERVVFDGNGNEIRRMQFNADGSEIADPDAGPVRWASMDGSDEGLDPKGEEQLANPPESVIPEPD